MWPELDRLRKQEKQKIMEYEKLEYGRNIKVWKSKLNWFFYKLYSLKTLSW